MQYDELSPEERDRLRASYEAGFAAGAYYTSLVPDELVELINAVAIDWFTSRETTQAAQRARYAYPGPEAIPEWLRAYAERHVLETAPLRGQP